MASCPAFPKADHTGIRSPGFLFLAIVLLSTQSHADFTDVTASAGVTYLERAEPVITQVVPEAAEQASGGAAAGDFDGDGWVDLAVSRGDAPPILFRNNGDGTFTDVTEQSGDLASSLPVGSNGLAFADIDNDGDLDVLIVNHAAAPLLYRNDSLPENAWIQIELAGTVSNRDGVGAVVTIDPDLASAGDEQTQHLLNNSNFLGNDELIVHFGLGPLVTTVDRVVVKWPSGREQVVSAVPIRTRTRIVEPATAVRFVEVAAAAGLVYEHGYTEPLESPDGSFDESRHFAGGIAAGDYDNDGYIDLYAVRGDIGPNLLFRNRGDGSFEEVGATAGVAIVGAAGSGPTFADVDGDGWLDLFVGGVKGTPVRLFRNRGDGTFADVTAASGLATERDTFSAAFGDYDRDGDLDLALAHWNELIGEEESSETLWRNDGSGRFTDVSVVSGVTPALGNGVYDFSFAPNFADIDNDGWPDLLIAGDFHTSKVLLNRRDGTFADATDTLVITDENGMGAAVGDYDNDGRLDWFVSSIFDPDGVAEANWGVTGNRLYRGVGDGSFEDVTSAAGVRQGFWGWGATWADVDNDSHLDLFHVNGFGRSADYEPSKAFYADPTRLFIANGDGTFAEQAVLAGIDDTGMGRGVVSFDYDRDGDIDLLVANSEGAPRLFRNDGGGGHWLTVKLRGAEPNTEGIGARVYARTGALRQMRELRAGSNFVSQDPAEAHFGLGGATVVDELLVVWPDGTRQVLAAVEVDQLRVLVAPEVIPKPTPTMAIPCAGDCDGDGVVTVDEVVRGVSIALGLLAPEICMAIDRDANRVVTVDEILAAVDATLRGCSLG